MGAAAKAAAKAAKNAAGMKGMCDKIAEGKAAACKAFNLNEAGCAAAPDCKFCGPNEKDNRPVGGCYYSGSTCQGVMFKFHYKKGACPAAPKALGDAAKGVANAAKAAGKAAAKEVK